LFGVLIKFFCSLIGVIMSLIKSDIVELGIVFCLCLVIETN
jgi:hypothetical protein